MFFFSLYCNVLRQLTEKEIPVSLYISASQSAWRNPSTDSLAYESCELLQAAAVNKDLFLVESPGLRRVKAVCQVSARCDIWADTDDWTGTLYQLCDLEK